MCGGWWSRPATAAASCGGGGRAGPIWASWAMVVARLRRLHEEDVGAVLLARSWRRSGLSEDRPGGLTTWPSAHVGWGLAGFWTVVAPGRWSGGSGRWCVDFFDRVGSEEDGGGRLRSGEVGSQVRVA
jgi:hypothetical protein